MKSPPHKAEEMDLNCNLCKTSKGIQCNSNELTAIEDIFKINLYELNICQPCKRKLKDFHKFYLMVKENVQALDVKDAIKEDFELPLVTVKLEELPDEDERKETAAAEDTFQNQDGFDWSRSEVEEEEEDSDFETNNKRETSSKYGSNKVKCPECGKELKKKSLKPHLDGHRKKEAKLLLKIKKSLCNDPYVCDLCQKTFKLYKSIKGHILNVHLRIFKYVCNVCGLGLKTSDSLQKHILYIHEKRDKDKCNICGRLVKNLSQHMNATHDSKSSLVCVHCGRGFVNKKSHARHVKLAHEGGRHKHKCPTCGKGYSETTKLKEHMQTHLGGFLYSCEFCSYQVNYKRNLRAHVKKQHTEEWIKQRHEYLSSIYDLNMLHERKDKPATALPNPGEALPDIELLIKNKS